MTTTVHLPRCDRFQSADAFGVLSQAFPCVAPLKVSYVSFRQDPSYFDLTDVSVTALRRFPRRFRLLARRLSLSLALWRGSYGKARACEEIFDGSRYEIGRLVLMGKTDKGGKRV
jgi:hypothetical protein